jgi:hypothetical protein
MVHLDTELEIAEAVGRDFRFWPGAPVRSHASQ